jgi:hypothetical protein
MELYLLAQMGDPTIDVTDEMREKSQEAKIAAAEAAAGGQIRQLDFHRLVFVLLRM